MYPRPAAFPCPLPVRPAFHCPLLPALLCPAFPCPFLWSPSCRSPIPYAPCQPCLFLPLPSSPAPLPCTAPACPPRWLPLPCPLFRWLWRPAAASLLCPACPFPLFGPPRGWPLCNPMEYPSSLVLIVLALSCYQTGFRSEARATPVEDRRPGIAIWLNPGVVPPPIPAVALRCITALQRRMVHVNGRICFSSATPTCMVYAGSRVPGS